jgi:hypothetical protein
VASSSPATICSLTLSEYPEFAFPSHDVDCHSADCCSRDKLLRRVRQHDYNLSIVLSAQWGSFKVRARLKPDGCRNKINHWSSIATCNSIVTEDVEASHVGQLQRIPRQARQNGFKCQCSFYTTVFKVPQFGASQEKPQDRRRALVLTLRVGNFRTNFIMQPFVRIVLG